MNRALPIAALLVSLAALTWVWIQARQVDGLERRAHERSADPNGGGVDDGAAAPSDGEERALPSADIRRRLGNVEQRVGDLERWLDARPAPGVAASPVREVAQLREDVDALMRAVPTDPAQEQEQLEATVRETLQRQRERRHQQHLELRQQESQKALGGFAEAAELSDEQREEMTRLYGEAHKATHELFTAAHDGQRSFRDLREEIRKVWSGVDAQLKELLDEDQFSLLEKMRQEQPGLGGPRRRPPH